MKEGIVYVPLMSLEYVDWIHLAEDTLAADCCALFMLMNLQIS
jgi:hypothetical protein